MQRPEELADRRGSPLDEVENYCRDIGCVPTIMESLHSDYHIANPEKIVWLARDDVRSAIKNFRTSIHPEAPSIRGSGEKLLNLIRDNRECFPMTGLGSEHAYLIDEIRHDIQYYILSPADLKEKLDSNILFQIGRYFGFGRDLSHIPENIRKEAMLLVTTQFYKVAYDFRQYRAPGDYIERAISAKSIPAVLIFAVAVRMCGHFYDVAKAIMHRVDTMHPARELKQFVYAGKDTLTVEDRYFQLAFLFSLAIVYCDNPEDGYSSHQHEISLGLVRMFVALSCQSKIPMLIMETLPMVTSLKAKLTGSSVPDQRKKFANYRMFSVLTWSYTSSKNKFDYHKVTQEMELFRWKLDFLEKAGFIRPLCVDTPLVQVPITLSNAEHFIRSFILDFLMNLDELPPHLFEVAFEFFMKNNKTEPGLGCHVYFLAINHGYFKLASYMRRNNAKNGYFAATEDEENDFFKRHIMSIPLPPGRRRFDNYERDRLRHLYRFCRKENLIHVFSFRETIKLKPVRRIYKECLKHDASEALQSLSALYVASKEKNFEADFDPYQFWISFAYLEHETPELKSLIFAMDFGI